MMTQLTKAVSWDDVMRLWRAEEERVPRWVQHYTNRGFSTWEAWRKNSIHDVHPEELFWSLHAISNLREVEEFYGGPFRAWQKKYYAGAAILQFQELAKNSELQSDPLIREIIVDFPKNSTLIGIKREGKIIIIEGMHRCSALSVAFLAGQEITAELTIALAEFDGELPTLGQENSPA